jgi:hypothetical protein
MSFEDRLKRIADEKERLAAEEASMREEAIAELVRLDAQIATLEERKAQIESILGLDDANNRAAHGQIMQLCIKFLSENGGGLTSSQVKDFIASENPGMKLSSVPATMSRLATQGRARRDEMGRYFIV